MVTYYLELPKVRDGGGKEQDVRTIMGRKTVLNQMRRLPTQSTSIGNAPRQPERAAHKMTAETLPAEGIELY